MTGPLAELDRYPKFRRYLESHQDELEERHIAKKATKNWYRTIDKVNARLTPIPKLLFPDMKMVAHPVLDAGGLYPHHNLYFVVSEKWDLEVLGGLLMSKVAEAFISAYCVKMRGGTLRFQAQYLRRIRLPAPDELDGGGPGVGLLREAFRNRDARTATGYCDPPVRGGGISGHTRWRLRFLTTNLDFKRRFAISGKCETTRQNSSASKASSTPGHEAPSPVDNT